MLYRLVAHTGLRRGEAVGLRWSDVDLAAGSLMISNQHVDVGYRVVHGEPKTKRGRRRIALDPGTLAHLAVHRRRQVEQALAVWLPDAASGFVFAREDGSPYHPDFVTKHFDLLVRRAGLPRIQLHDLRHTHATLGLAAGIPAKVMADRLGHSWMMPPSTHTATSPRRWTTPRPTSSPAWCPGRGTTCWPVVGRCPIRKISRRTQTGIGAGQHGCAARDSNPEPAD
ncbi:MAG: site-specific integrase [Mycobacteriales bacterium]